MYDKRQLITAARNPRRIVRGLLHPKKRAIELHNLINRKRIGSKHSIDIADQDWDNLLILDACRYDIFASTSTIDGELTPVISRGSRTSEFLRNNFREPPYHNIVYVTANPMYTNLTDFENQFHAIIPVYRNRWDDELNTVHPSDLTDAVIEAQNKFPHKQIIGHYNQPHIPHIGQSRARLEQLKTEYSAELSKDLFGPLDIVSAAKKNYFWQLLASGIISRSEAIAVYRESLEVTLPFVEDACNKLRGKTVVTGDHGEAFGESGPFSLDTYGHPGRVFMRELVEVPRLVIDGDRREIRAEESITTVTPDSTAINERLEHLGYKG